MSAKTISLSPNPAIEGREARFTTLTIDIAKVMESWRHSLLAHDWLTREGTLKDIDALDMVNRERFLQAYKALENGESLPRPVLGIGLFDNVEIGAGRAVFCAAAARGETRLSVHVLLSNADELAAFTA